MSTVVLPDTLSNTSRVWRSISVGSPADTILPAATVSGRSDSAIIELTPVTKDAVNGSEIMQFLGVIYAWTGEKDLAIKQIAATLQVPSDLSYGQLRLHPFWDLLRGDPRFEKLIEESKKPVAMK